MKAIAFDFDGTLDTKEGTDIFKQIQRRGNRELFIVSSSPTPRIDEYIDEIDIRPNERVSALIKMFPLRRIKTETDASDFIYVGNSYRDRLASRIAGWEYVDITDLPSSDKL